jgi:hypothetical protein
MPYSLLGLSFISVGLVLSVLGVIFSIHSALQRTMYIDRLKEAQQNFEARVVEPEVEPEVQLKPVQRKHRK